MENVLNELLKSIPDDIRSEVFAKLQRCTSGEEVLELCKSYQIPVTEQTADAVSEFLEQPTLLSEEDLNKVAGGSGYMSSFACRTDRCSGGA